MCPSSALLTLLRLSVHACFFCALCLRALMSFSLPWVMREGVAMAFVFSMARDGVEVSLPKVLGAALMFMIVFIPILKFGAPRVVRLLDRGSAVRRVKPT